MIGAIVAGGESSRFGGDPKGLREVGGVRIIDRVAAALEPSVSELLVVANAPDARSWLSGARVVADDTPRRGSLLGLRTALAAAHGDDVFVVAWDMPFVTRELVALVRSRLTPPVRAAVPEAVRSLEPFCAAYSARCLPVADALLARGEMRASALIDELPVVRRVGPSELAAVGATERLFFNVNTPEDLAAAEAMARED